MLTIAHKTDKAKQHHKSEACFRHLSRVWLSEWSHRKTGCGYAGEYAGLNGCLSVVHSVW